jgi:nucleotidyltransferase substrate binding protein (TIGR01987 family)
VIAMNLDLSSLKNAAAQLEEALAYCESEAAKSDHRLAHHLRAGAIQAFEYTYELSFKYLKRYLAMTEPDPTLVREMTFNEVIRRGYEMGLLKAELAEWKAFRRDRGTASHAYDEKKALDVYKSIPEFLAEAKYLLRELEKRRERQSG